MKIGILMKSLRACAFVAFISLTACGHIAAQSTSAGEATTALNTAGDQKTVGLAINGFNYTDLVIDFFSVAYQGGGNIAVSSPTSGGGGTTCCVSWRPGTKLPMPIHIEWTRYLSKKVRTCEKTVMLKGQVPKHPTAIGVHFMPDGEVQVELSEGYPELKLKLANYDDGHRKRVGNVIHDEQTARCRDGW